MFGWCGNLWYLIKMLKGLDEWYVSNVSIIFEWSMLVLWYCHMFLISIILFFMHFVGLTYWQDAQCQFPVFAIFFISEIYFWKYSRNWTEIYGKFLFARRHLRTRGRPGGPPTGQGRPAAPTGGTRPYSWDASLAPLDTYKLPHDLKMSRRPLFSREVTPSRRHHKP